jgi:3-hydroxyacyl-[acyl-carrier-protein] dehydratase|tara:strand:- start:1814 stop:2275 length:462 start_codon:yes stop_codon:yes gene_type:complete
MRPFSLDEKKLLLYQPNRPPFLMIDYVTEVLPGKYANGFKNLDENEWFFPIHFPGNPNMPGALQLEALAQMLTVAITTLPDLKGKVTHAISHTVKFKKEVIPGRKYEIKTKINSWSRGICKGVGQGFTDGEVACEAEMIITIPEILKSFLPKK